MTTHLEFLFAPGSSERIPSCIFPSGVDDTSVVYEQQLVASQTMPKIRPTTARDMREKSTTMRAPRLLLAADADHGYFSQSCIP